MTNPPSPSSEKKWYQVTEERALELKLIYNPSPEIQPTGDPEFPFRVLLSWEQFWNSIHIKTTH